MEKLVNGIHHVSMKCCGQAEFEKTLKFYSEVLGIPVLRSWAGGAMLDTGSGIIELFPDAKEPKDAGVIRHFAFAVSDVDACAKAVKAAGYDLYVEPKDVVIPSDPAFPIRIAFCKGPLGEDIEFFQER